MLLEHGISATHVLSAAIGIDPVLALVTVAMQCDLVTALDHVSCQVGMALDLGAEDEEGRARARPVEGI